MYKETVFLDNCIYFKEVLSTFKYTLLSVRLMKLNAGAFIKEHKDAELCYEKGEISVHIPVVTHEEVDFFLDKERMNLKEGECWYMNFNLLHSVNNKSNIDRVHLVIDAKVNEWVENLFKRKAKNKKEILGPNYDGKTKEIFEPGYDDKTKEMIIARLRELNTETSNRMADEMKGIEKQ